MEEQDIKTSGYWRCREEIHLMDAKSVTRKDIRYQILPTPGIIRVSPLTGWVMEDCTVVRKVEMGSRRDPLLFIPKNSISKQDRPFTKLKKKVIKMKEIKRITAEWKLWRKMGRIITKYLGL